ncbi:portal protein [Pseudomonas phage Zuri]|uniref:Portal protein n=1 Tax=Pseudomonas phage Zuri TaxID=2604899 RepID=A0A5C1K732_9CAUD|nr:portal protein [Pseudomonas phage Zuri]QEM41177.1 portal protein [Pseudomonas phage Zuri]
MEDNAPQPADISQSRLTDWVKEPELRNLKQDLESGRHSHQAQMSRIAHWNDLLQVKGKAKPPVVKGRSSVQPKLIRRQAEWRYSALTEPFLGSNKLFKVGPVTFEDTEAARQNDLVLNWQFRTKMNRVKLIDDMVRATVDEGTSVLRVGWKRITTMVNVEAPVFSFYQIQTQEQLDQLQQALEAFEADRRHFDENTPEEIKQAVTYYKETGQAVFAQQTGTQMVPTEKVLENRPLVEVMNPNNVVIDPSCCGDINKAMFAVVSFETSKADLLKEPKRYKNLEFVNWEGATPLGEPDHLTTTPNDFNFADGLRKKVVAYEYWGFQDITGDGKLTPIVCTWIGDVMIRLEENPFPDGKLPFVVIPYLPVKRDLYGETDAELLEDSQKILGALTRGMLDLMGRSANSQEGMPKGMLDALNRRRYDNGQDYEYNPNQNPAVGIIQHKYPEIPQSALMMLNLHNQEAESLTGVKSFSGGLSGEAYGDVAAGIRGVLDAASKREMAILRRLAKGMCDVGEKIISMNAVFLSEEEVIRVTNQEFVTVRREDLVGNFDLITDISTAEVDNAKSQDLAFMLQTLGPNSDPGMAMLILAEIADLKRMPELAEKIRKFRPQPTPEQQRLQELAIQKAELENQKLQSEVELNQAKAEEARASKDLKNLDYVEQESGTKHAREMEKQKAQSQGNQNLQVTKALTTPTKEGEKAPDIAAAVGFNQVSDKMNEAGPGLGGASMIQRDIDAAGDPALNLRSQQFNPSQDPALNPANNL